MAIEGLGWDPLLKMFHNPGGDDCILGGGTTQTIYVLWWIYPRRMPCNTRGKFEG